MMRKWLPELLGVIAIVAIYTIMYIVILVRR